MNIHVKLPDRLEQRRLEADADLEASAWGRSIADELREVAWLTFVVAALSTAGAGLGVVLALALDGYLV